MSKQLMCLFVLVLFFCSRSGAEFKDRGSKEEVVGIAQTLKKLRTGPIALTNQDALDSLGRLIASVTKTVDFNDLNNTLPVCLAFLSSQAVFSYRPTLPEQKKMQLRLNYQVTERWLKMSPDSVA